MTRYCPLSMISGKPVECVRNCHTCIPSDINEIRYALDKLKYLEYPERMFGTSNIESGLNSVADAIENIPSTFKVITVGGSDV